MEPDVFEEKPVDPSEAPRDGHRVLFCIPDGNGGERVVIAWFDAEMNVWSATNHRVVDVSSATMAQFVGPPLGNGSR